MPIRFSRFVMLALLLSLPAVAAAQQVSLTILHTNDTHGHQVGDQVLVEVAKLLRDGAREIDVVGRWGGEEFLVCCPYTDSLGAGLLAEKLRKSLQEHRFPVVETKTASFGVATFRKGDTAKDMVARADSALYQAKHYGRNQVRIWSSDEHEVV